jgi:hydroxymethylpyrimidine/phosphomethylpyrimidine kinase
MRKDNPRDDRPPVCLTIAGLDPSGGAGVIADIRTFSAFGCFSTAAITSVTFQNSTGISGALHHSPRTVRKQIESVTEDYDVAAVKIGMLPTLLITETVAGVLKEHALTNIVIDPVIRSTSGFQLMDEDALTGLITHLFPLATLVTPNIPEAEKIARLAIGSTDEIERAAAVIRGMGAVNVLIKGGHFDEASGKARDYLFIDDELTILAADRVDGRSVHGTGCVLSSAIAANLALGKDLMTAVNIAKEFITKAIRNAPDIGKGDPPPYF